MKKTNANLSSISALVLFACVITSAHANIYKTTDSNGVTVFTDNAERSTEMTKVDVTPVSTVPAYRSNSVGRSDAHYQNPEAIEMAEKAPDEPLISEREKRQAQQLANTNYKLKLVSPLPESTYRRGVGNVNVSVAMTPSLKPGHAVVLEIDGKRIAHDTSGSYPTVNLHRGSHTATAKVIDTYGKPMAQTQTTFFVHQPSKIIQDKRKAAENEKKQADVPWWKRIKIKL